MTVEFIPKNDGCFCFGVSNITWFSMLKNTDIAKVLDVKILTNDPIVATEDQALRSAEALKKSKGILQHKEPVERDEVIAMFVDFFESCGGFSTY